MVARTLDTLTILPSTGHCIRRTGPRCTGQTGAGAFAGRPSAITLAAFIRQADAAYDFLRGQPVADPGRMLVAGHSEGGMYALLVAESVSPRPAGLARQRPRLTQTRPVAPRAWQQTATNEASVLRVPHEVTFGRDVTDTM